jgi:hypothetical protein
MRTWVKRPESKPLMKPDDKVRGIRKYSSCSYDKEKEYTTLSFFIRRLENIRKP